MPTNFHSDLPNDQLHNPKEFGAAHKNSVVTKNNSEQLSWVKANYALSSTITATLASGETIMNLATRLHDSSFTLCQNDTTKYAVYFDSGSLTSTFTPPVGYTGVQVNIVGDANISEVHTALASALNALTGITSSVNAGGFVDVSGMQSAPHTTDVSTGLVITNTETPTGNEFLQTDGSGNIEWGTAPGGGGCSNSWGAINTEGGSFPTANGCGDTLVLTGDGGRHIDIFGDNALDTVKFRVHSQVQFRGNVEPGLEPTAKYAFRQDNNKDQKFQQLLGAGGALNAAQVINAAKVYPNTASVLKSVVGFASAPTGTAAQLTLYRYSLICGDAEAGASITPNIAAQSDIINFTGNNVPMCFDMSITTLDYGSYDLLVPVWEWTSEEAGSGARTFWKITMY